ncbi:MAG: hypothetical protein P1Q69_20565 [Candidatus Thorarchaeota archaeon]|nr:hypothetical protein [Candidatus Thorarchaeota archaeon]
MNEGYWYTSIGTSAAAAYNPIWASYLQNLYMPSEVVIFRLLPRNPDDRQIRKLHRTYDEFIRWLERFRNEIKKDISIHPIECIEEDYNSYDKTFINTLKSHSDKSRAIDITPGRKYASARGMAFGITEKVEHIFYLHLHDNAYLETPLPEIPMMKWTLQDFGRR